MPALRLAAKKRGAALYGSMAFATKNEMGLHTNNV